MSKARLRFGRTLGLTCQHVVDVGHYGLLSEVVAEELLLQTILDQILESLHVWVAHPRSRINASRWHVVGRDVSGGGSESTGAADRHARCDLA